MPPIRKRTKKTADHAVNKTEEMLGEAGCAVNELVQNDYGFDLHVQLPEEYPDIDADQWPMSPYSVLIQVKGGAYVRSGVRLDVDRWEYLLNSMSPVYIAAVPEATTAWIASVEELLPTGVEYIATQSFEVEPVHPSWDPKAFVSGALLNAKLGSPRLRRWWRQLQPDLSHPNPRERGHALLLFLLDLAVLQAISGATMDVSDFDECAEKAREMVAGQHQLVEALKALQLAHETSGGLEIDVDLPVYVPEGHFVEQSGRVTHDGLAGSNNLTALSGQVSLRHLATPTIESFLAGLDLDEYDPEEYW